MNRTTNTTASGPLAVAALSGAAVVSVGGNAAGALNVVWTLPVKIDPRTILQ